jgi:type IV secretion system protein VirB4
MNMRSKEELLAAAEAQIPAADYIPFGRHASPTVVKLKGTGDYLATWRLEGISFETADAAEILARKEGLHNFIQALGGGKFAVWSHKVRRNVRERLEGEYDNDFCRDFNNRYYAGFDDRDEKTGELLHKQMATELYLTLVYRPTPSRASRILKRLNTRSVEEIKAQENADLDVVDDISKQVESSLSRYRPERLETFARDGIVYSELAAFLGFLVNGVWEDVPLRRAELAEYLPTSRLLFGDRNGLAEIWHPKAHKFAGFLDMQDYPRFSEPGMNNAILYGEFEYIETQSFSIMNKRDALDALKRQKGQLSSSADVSESEIKHMADAQDDLGSGKFSMGEYHYTLAVFGETLQLVAKNMAEARTALQDGPGFKMASIDAIPECAWFAQLPGNWGMRPREATITSLNFVSLSPFHNFARGKRTGNPWGEALALLRTPSLQPYYLNYHVSPDDEDVTDKKYPGNTAIIGTTGVGKTTLAVGLMMFQLKVSGFRGVFFDKDRGAEIAIRRIGGKYFALKRGVPTGFAPLQMKPTEENITHCEKLIWLLVGPGNPEQRATEEADIAKAVRTVMHPDVSLESRRVSSVWQRLPTRSGGNTVKDRLHKWTGNNGLGWVFDNPRDTQDFSNPNIRIYGYDYTEFLDDPEICTPMMAYLLHITNSLINGQPFAYWMEEFWKPLKNPFFVDFIEDTLKTIRKLFGVGIFMTQSPSDVLKHEIAKTIVEQCVTKFYLPNPSADRDDYVEGFKVTEQEYTIIKNLGEQSRMFLVKQGHRSAVVKFDLGGMPEVLQIISGDLPNVELLDEIRLDVGNDPEVWAPIFHKRIAERRAIAKTRKG